MALVRLDRKRLLVAARHTPRGVVWMEMPQLLGLSYQVILPSKRRRILLANCPQEAECVNSQVMPCNAVPSGWPLCQCSGTLRGMLQSSLLVCVADSYHFLNSELSAEYFYYVSCLYVTFPECVVHVLSRPCRALSMNLEP